MPAHRTTDLYKDLAEDIRKANGGKSVLNISEFGRYMGWCQDTTRKYCAGLVCVQFGKEKLFRVADLAKMLEEHHSISTYG